jgi:tetratricopeptide (TPR) repeat protein
VERRRVLSGDLARLAAEVSVVEGRDRERGLELAARAVPADSRDFRDHLWLGQVSLSAGQKDKAEAAFRRALALNEAAPETWVALVVFLAGAERRAEAAQELERARRVLAPAVAPLALAPGYEALDERQKAEEQYQALLKDRPDDPHLLRSAINFYLRGGQTPQAEALLNRLAQWRRPGGEEPAAWARRVLALLLASSGDYRQTDRALALIDQNLTDRPTPQDERARALVLATRPGERRRSIRTLEDSFSRLRPTPYELFLLARLYEADRNDGKANELFLGLLTARDGDTPLFLSQYILFLLRRDSLGEAAVWLARLEAKEPQAARTVELRARLRSKQGQGDQAAKELEALGRREAEARKDPRPLAQAALVLEQIDRPLEAERLYREFVAQARDRDPDRALVLVTFLARQGRLPEALEALEQASARATPEVVARAGVAALRLAEAKEAHFRQVERLLEAGLRARPGSADLLLIQADLRDAEGRYAEAVRLYRQVLARAPDNAVALNNLAWLLALHQGKGAEALDLLERAGAVAGRAGRLLDSRGVVLIGLGRYPEAIRSLEEAVTEVPTGARYFHLAQAYLAARDRDEARKAWRRSQELGIKPYELHALERAEYQRLQGELGGR